MVSTDDEEIAHVARQYGASVPFMRSAETANDFATTADVLKEVIEKYHEMGQIFDNFCCFYIQLRLFRVRMSFLLLNVCRIRILLVCIL